MSVYLGYSSDGLILIMLRRKFVIKRNAISKPFLFDGCNLDLFENDYNCGYSDKRMTERAVELSILRHWIKDKENVFEVGAVSPYYFPGVIKDICDPADEHEKVNYRQSLFDIDFSGRNVVCISTIEHVGTFEHGLDLVESPAEGLEKLIKESRTLLVTFPCGYNPVLDDYIRGGGYRSIELPEDELLEVFAYKRGVVDNIWKKIPIERAKRIKYSKNFGTLGLCVVTKRKEYREQLIQKGKS